MIIINEERTRALLALSLPDNDSEASTVRGYLVALLHSLWTEGGDFSGKRPFGNSGWKFDLYKPMVEAGFVTGLIDDGELTQFPDDARREADELIMAGIELLGRES